MFNNIYNLVRVDQLSQVEVSGFVLDIVLPLLTGFGSTGTLTGNFYPLQSNPSGFITFNQTGIFVTTNNTGNFLSYNDPRLISTIISQTNPLYYPLSSNPSGYLTNETGTLTGSFYPLGANPSGYLTTGSISGAGNVLITYNNNGSVTVSQASGSISGSEIVIFGDNLIISGLTENENIVSFYGPSGQNLNFLETGNNLLLFNNTGNLAFSDQFNNLTTLTQLLQSTGNTGTYYPLYSNPSGYLTTGQISGLGEVIITYDNNGSFTISSINGSITGSGIILYGNNIIISGLVENQPIITYFGLSGQNVNFIETGNNLLIYNTTGNLSFSDEYNSLITLTQILASTGNTGSYYPLNTNPSGYLTTGEISGLGNVIVSYNNSGYITISQASGSLNASGTTILGSNITFSGTDLTQNTLIIYGSVSGLNTGSFITNTQTGNFSPSGGYYDRYYNPIYKNLLIYCPFNEGNGIVTYDKANNISCFVSGNWTSGIFGGGLNFNIVNYVLINSQNMAGLSGITLAAWINCNTVNSSQSQIISKHFGGTNGEFYLAMANSNTIQFTTINTSLNRVDFQGVSSKILTDSNWHFITSTYDGNTLCIYVDGQLLNSNINSQSGLLQNTNNLCMIGAHAGQFGNTGDTYPFIGSISEPMIFSRALSQNEIRFLNNQYTFSNVLVSNFVMTDQTGNFYTNNNPSGFITGFNSGIYTLNSNTGNFLISSQTGNFVINSSWSYLNFNTGTTIWTGSQNVVEDKRILILTGSTTLSISGLYNGFIGLLQTIQSGSGFNLTLPSNTKVMNNGSGIVYLTTGISGARDFIGFEYDGINLYATVANYFS